jgi:DNA-binding NarL/FixJ family response regulator
MEFVSQGYFHTRSVPMAALCATPRKALLVDDHDLVRHGVISLYAELNGTCVEWLEAASLQEGIEAYSRVPDIDAVLLDLNLADCKGLQGLRQFLKVHPAARIAILSATQDEFVVRQARSLGAVGYVGKGSGREQMEEGLTALLWPDGVMSARAAAPARSPLFPRLPASAMFDRAAELGPRHLEILELVLSGCTNQEISTSTSLSLGTVKNYVSSLLLSLDVKSRSHLVSLFR